MIWIAMLVEGECFLQGHPNQTGGYRFLVLFFNCMLTFGSYFCFDMPSVLQDEIQGIPRNCSGWNSTDVSSNSSSHNGTCDPCADCLGMSPDNYNLLYAIYVWTNAVVVIGAGFLIDKLGNREWDSMASESELEESESVDGLTPAQQLTMLYWRIQKRNNVAKICVALITFMIFLKIVHHEPLRQYIFQNYPVLTENSFRDWDCNNCSSTNFKYILNPINVCTSGNWIKVLFVVTSKSIQVQNRNMIRKTWGSYEEQRKYNIKVVFLLGKSSVPADDRLLISESETYGDILQINLIENYRTITFKTAEAFKWTIQGCQHVQYVMKCDDDIFINMENLMSSLNSYNLDNSVGGKVVTFGFPDRRKQEKFYVTYNEYPLYFLPLYCAGPGYIMTLDTAKKIYFQQINTRFFIWEDVFVGIVAFKAGITVTNLPGFHDIRYSYKHSCTTLHHKMDSSDVLKFWNIGWQDKLYPCIPWMEYLENSIILCLALTLVILIKKIK